MTFLHLSGGIPSIALYYMASRRRLKTVPDAALFIENDPVLHRLVDFIDDMPNHVRDADTEIPIIRVEGPSYRDHLEDLHHYQEEKFIKRACAHALKGEPLAQAAMTLTGGEEATIWLSVTKDAVMRMRGNRHPKIKHHFPFIDDMPRHWEQCRQYLVAKGLPMPKLPAACPFCPFLTPFDRKSFVHSEYVIGRECQVVFRERIGHDRHLMNEDPDSSVAHFGNECEGLCNT